MQFYRFYILVIGLSPFILLAWVLSNPQAVLDKLFRLRRWYRRRLERKHGIEFTHRVLRGFRQAALQQGFTQKEIDAVIKEHKDRLIQEDGKRMADHLYGKYESHPLERDY